MPRSRSGSPRGGGGGGSRYPPNDKKVFIGNLDENVTKADLEELFRKAGPLRKDGLWVARQPPGFGFAEFEDERDARDACKEYDGAELRGRKIRVELSTGRTKQGGSSSSSSRGGSRDECYGCGETGHFSRDCPKMTSEPSLRFKVLTDLQILRPGS